MTTAYTAIETGAQRSSSLRLSAICTLGLFSVIILLGISQRSADMTEYQRYYDSAVVDNVHSIEERMGPVIKGLHDMHTEKETSETKRRRRRRRRRVRGPPAEPEAGSNNVADIPDPKDLSNTESVWDFLYHHTDDELIMFTRSQDEEANLRDEDLNIITLLIKKVEMERADEWLVQLAIWFHAVAEHWPKDIILSQRAVAAIEELLSEDFSGVEDVSEDVLKQMVEHQGSIPALEQEEMTDDEVADAQDEGAIKRVQQIVKAIHDLVESGDIQGKVATARLASAIDRLLSLKEWRKLLSFVVSVAEAAPMFEEYLVRWRETQFHSVKDVVFESSPVKKEEQLEVAAKLLGILERGCESYPRTSKLIRATFLKELNDEDKAEKAAKAVAMASPSGSG